MNLLTFCVEFHLSDFSMSNLCSNFRYDDNPNDAARTRVMKQSTAKMILKMKKQVLGYMKSFNILE